MPAINTVSCAMWDLTGPRLVLDESVDRIILYAQQEFEYDKYQDFSRLVSWANDHNVEMVVIIGTSNFVRPIAHSGQITLVNWGTYWFTAALYSISYNTVTTCNKSAETTFILMNNKPHWHRAMLMDELAKNDLIRYGNVSWLNDDVYGPGYNWYVFRYWNQEHLALTERAKNKEEGHFMPPSEYELSFVQLVSESSVDQLALTEKTCVPLLMRKPFIVFGAATFHDMLIDYGFLLYTELFDYTFDQEPDPGLRCTAIVENIRLLNVMSLSEREDMLITIAPKLEFNYQLAVRLATDINNVPDIVSEQNHQFGDPRLIRFIKNYGTT